MDADEKAIRELMSTWFAASKAGDVDAVLNLMSEDVVFMTPGKEPFGKEAFAAASKSMKGVQIDGTSEIVELNIHGRWAWMRSRLRVVVTPPSGKSMARAGYTLTILQKNLDERWVITRDANLLGVEAGERR